MAVFLHHQQAVGRFERTASTAAHVGQGVLGVVCLLSGVVLTSTLFLIPVSVPLALFGVALILGRGGEDHRI